MKHLLTPIIPVIGMLASGGAMAEPVRLLVSIENLAPANGTAQTPHWVGFHDGERFDIYNGGTPADFLPVPNDPARSVERLAEDGNTDPISATFREVIPEGVDGVIAGPNGPIAPGETAVAIFEVDSTDINNRYFSYGSMLLPSNDFWYANGNPKAHQIFDESGAFVANNFIVTRDDLLDAGTELNTEIPAETAFFGQSQPNTGVNEGGVIRDFDANDPETFFQRPGSGGILDDPRFAMGDFTVDGYPLVKISFGVAPIVDIEANYYTRLKGDAEVPPIDSNAVGIARYKLRDGGESLTFDHLMTLRRKQIQAMHLHLGSEGENGPVVATLFMTGDHGHRRSNGRYQRNRRGFAHISGSLSNGDLQGPLNGQPLDALVKEINAGNIYVNVHTRRFPSGELRGQLATQKK